MDITLLLKVSKWESNHLLCKATGLVKTRLFKSPPLLIYKLKLIILYNSYLLKYVNTTFKTKYNVYDILENDIDALKARIFYVHDEYVELFV